MNKNINFIMIYAQTVLGGKHADAFTHTSREPSDMAIGIDHLEKSRGAATTTVTQPAKSV